MSEMDIQTCPRRVNELGPWNHDDGMDQWVTGRWYRTQAEADAAAEEFARKHPGGSMSRFYWSDGEPPRTCSFCGGVHPEDAIALVQRGWEIEATGKGFKRYLHPPGYRGATAILLEWIRNGSQGDRPPAVLSPVPPVKLYVMHFSDDQIRRFNAALPPQRYGDQH